MRIPQLTHNEGFEWITKVAVDLCLKISRKPLFCTANQPEKDFVVGYTIWGCAISMELEQKKTTRKEWNFLKKQKGWGVITLQNF